MNSLFYLISLRKFGAKYSRCTSKLTNIYVMCIINILIIKNKYQNKNNNLSIKLYWLGNYVESTKIVFAIHIIQ